MIDNFDQAWEHIVGWVDVYDDDSDEGQGYYAQDDLDETDNKPDELDEFPDLNELDGGQGYHVPQADLDELDAIDYGLDELGGQGYHMLAGRPGRDRVRD